MQRFLVRERGKAAAGRVQHILLGIAAAHCPQRPHQEAAQPVAKHAVLAGQVMGDACGLQGYVHNAVKRGRIRQGHRHARPGNPGLMPGVEHPGHMVRLGKGMGCGVNGYTGAVPFKGQVAPCEQGGFQVAQGGGLLHLLPIGQVAQLPGHLPCVQLTDQLGGAAALGEENAPVGGLLRVHGEGDGQAACQRRGLYQQGAHGLLQHVEAVHKQRRAVHHAAGGQAAHKLLLLGAFVGKAAGKKRLVGLPDQRQVGFLGPCRAGGKGLGVLPQRFRGQAAALHVAKQAGQPVRQSRLRPHPAVVGKLLPAQGQRLAQRHGPAAAVQGRERVAPAALPHPAHQPPGRQNVNVHQAGKLQPVHQLALGLQGILLGHQQQHTQTGFAACAHLADEKGQGLPCAGTENSHGLHDGSPPCMHYATNSPQAQGAAKIAVFIPGGMWYTGAKRRRGYDGQGNPGAFGPGGGV